MNVLLVAKLSNQTLTENILSPLLKSSYVDHVYVLRDFPGDMIDGKVTYLSPEKVSESRIRHIRKVVAGVRYCSKYKIDVIIGVLNTPHGYIGKAIGAMMNIPYIHITIAGHREFWLGGKPGSIQESPDNYGYRTTNACLPGVQGLRCGQDCCAAQLAQSGVYG